MSHTLVAPVSHVLEVKHSRFIVHAAPVATPEEALAFLARIGDAAATHNCWAYRIGPLYRSSDDGEPAGTAGRPILAAIDGQGFDQVMVVVTRWYGGIKLGAGGLVRAYGGSAAECLRVADRRPLVVLCTVSIAFPFDATGSVHGVLGPLGAERLDEQFGPKGPSLLVRLPADRLDALRLQLRDATRDRASVTVPSTPA